LQHQILVETPQQVREEDEVVLVEMVAVMLETVAQVPIFHQAVTLVLQEMQGTQEMVGMLLETLMA
jgi:hypothetical protein